jgi:hypothetical protein
VIVRRRRGVGQGELELNSEHEWRIRVQAPTWNTVLDLPGLDVREIHIDSGAVRVDCILPRPRGVVPITISGGTVGVRLRRPPGVYVEAEISPACLQLRLDAFTVAATASDLRWQSAGPASEDRYRVLIKGGAARVSLEEDPSITELEVEPGPESGDVVSALELLLDGIDHRVGGGVADGD